MLVFLLLLMPYFESLLMYVTFSIIRFAVIQY